MNVAVLHYHLNRGGVTQVIANPHTGPSTLSNYIDAIVIVLGVTPQVDNYRQTKAITGALGKRRKSCGPMALGSANCTTG